MKYLKKFNESATPRKSSSSNRRPYYNWATINDTIGDCLIDIRQIDNMEYYIDQMRDSSFYGDITNIVINSKGAHFPFSVVKESINDLISIMENREGYSLIGVRYYYSFVSKPGYASVCKWEKISMDPTDGFVSGDGIENISDDIKLKMFELSFSNSEYTNESYWSDIKNKQKDISSDIDNILIELKDNGFQIDNSFNREDKYVSILGHNNQHFERNEVVEYIIRLGEYLESLGYKINDVYFNSNKYTTKCNEFDRFVFNSRTPGLVKSIKLKIIKDLSSSVYR